MRPINDLRIEETLNGIQSITTGYGKSSSLKYQSDSAKTEISKKVMDISRAYHISNWYSELYQQNQNPTEQRYRTIKSWTNTVMNRSGAPANCCLLCMISVCYISNHIACGALHGSIPLLVLYGITPDISIMLLYTPTFYELVFYEFAASKTATEQIIDLRHTLRNLGVLTKTKSYLFGDNRSVVTSCTLPHSTLGKRHNILAYHQVREAIASKILAYHWI